MGKITFIGSIVRTLVRKNQDFSFLTFIMAASGALKKAFLLSVLRSRAVQ
ncbi:hypothetical protein [Microcoleus sp.]